MPVTLRDDELAVLTIRFMGSAVPLKSALERFLPKLRQFIHGRDYDCRQISIHIIIHDKNRQSSGAPRTFSISTEMADEPEVSFIGQSHRRTAERAVEDSLKVLVYSLRSVPSMKFVTNFVRRDASADKIPYRKTRAAELLSTPDDFGGPQRLAQPL